ncbi:MAG: hypothetical protein FJZ16_01310 [Candidatus Omnitrophica bacterium]|nr:hypothetical protein [Candidatus Omnitrophota bacterium]
MKRYIFFLFLLLLIGCDNLPKQKKFVVKINNYTITQGEFEEEFKNTSAEWLGPDAQKEEFLENIINRKLLLQEAECLGLNKDREFLKNLERFYEQSLLKIVINNKSNELALKTQVSDSEIEAYYNEMVKKKLIEKPFPEVYKEIKLQLLRQKQAQAFNDWVEELRKKAKIEVDKKALGIEYINKH